jgi:hypothetical protein
VLQAIEVKALFLKIKEDAALADEVTRLRKLRMLDLKAYKKLKVRLPYFVGASFEGNVRHSAQFKFASYLTIDIDDYFEENTLLPELLLQHPAVMLAFVSPSGTGFKVVFKLNTPCHSLEKYKEFYRNFSRVFAEQVHLAGSIDMKTCDATRACFLGHDPNAYFHPNAEALEWQRFVSHDILEEEAEATPKKELNEGTLAAVMDKINPNRPIKKKYEGYVPEELLMIENDIKVLCMENQLTLNAILPINYGLKIQIKQGYSAAEINVFYGKKGFTVVRSPKTGTDAKLAEAFLGLMQNMLFAPYQAKKEVGEDLSVLLSLN